MTPLLDTSKVRAAGSPAEGISPMAIAELRIKSSATVTSFEKTPRGLVADLTARMGASPASMLSCCTCMGVMVSGPGGFESSIVSSQLCETRACLDNVLAEDPLL